jgi:hypothetical protein
LLCNRRADPWVPTAVRAISLSAACPAAPAQGAFRAASARSASLLLQLARSFVLEIKVRSVVLSCQ